MRIIPYGKATGFSATSNINDFVQTDEQADEQVEEQVQETQAVDNGTQSESDKSLSTEQKSKVQQIENAIDDILGEPSLDSLMIVLSAIGMSKISLSMSEDQSHLSVTGIINLSEDKKIKKE